MERYLSVGMLVGEWRKIFSLLLVLLSLELTAHALTANPLPEVEGEESPSRYFEQGTEYYGKGQFNLALERFSLAALAGNSDAAIQVGLMHDFGRGVPRNFIEASRWYQLAANQGSGKGIFLLGHMEEFGEGRPRSFARAYRWYSVAADMGEPDAQYSLGQFYYQGKFVRPNQQKAVHWLSLAAGQCHQSAKLLLEKLAPEKTVKTNPGC